MNICLDVVDYRLDNFVLQDEADLGEAATARKVDSPVFFSVLLVFNLDPPDALKEKWDQELSFAVDNVQDLALLH